MKNKFNLFSLTGMRLERAVQKSENYQLDWFSLGQIVKILHDNDVHILYRPQTDNPDARALANNIYSLDPIRIHYIVQSEAEYNLLELLHKPEHDIEAEDIVKTIAETEFSFVHRPNTSQEKVWSFITGSAPVVYVHEEKQHLPKDHPTIQRASYLGRQKSMRYPY